MKRTLTRSILLLLFLNQTVLAQEKKKNIGFSIENQVKSSFIEAHANSGKLRTLESFFVSETEENALRFRFDLFEKWSLTWQQGLSLADLISGGETSTKTHVSGLHLYGQEGSLALEASYTSFEKGNIQSFNGKKRATLEFRSDVVWEKASLGIEYIAHPQDYSPVKRRNKSRTTEQSFSGSWFLGARWDSLNLRGNSPVFSSIPVDALGDEQNFSRAHLQTYNLYGGYGVQWGFWESFQLTAALKVGGGYGHSKALVGASTITEDHITKLILGEMSVIHLWKSGWHLGVEIASGSAEFETPQILFQGNDHQFLFFVGL